MFGTTGGGTTGMHPWKYKTLYSAGWRCFVMTKSGPYYLDEREQAYRRKMATDFHTKLRVRVQAKRAA